MKPALKDTVYTHFDNRTHYQQFEKLVCDSEWVERHGFYPFVHLEMELGKYSKGEGRIEKTRHILETQDNSRVRLDYIKIRQALYRDGFRPVPVCFFTVIYCIRSKVCGAPAEMCAYPQQCVRNVGSCASAALKPVFASVSLEAGMCQACQAATSSSTSRSVSKISSREGDARKRQVSMQWRMISVISG